MKVNIARSLNVGLSQHQLRSNFGAANRSEPEQAIAWLRACLEVDPTYTAAQTALPIVEQQQFITEYAGPEAFPE